MKGLSPVGVPCSSYEHYASISSFDNTECVPAILSRPERYKQLITALSIPNVITRGAGLSYCLASALDHGRSISSNQFDRFLGFDEKRNIARVEPGVTMGALAEFAIARNLIPPVLPGYPLVTVGGAVAMNIHGKNQFRVGNFCNHVRNLSLFHPSRGEVDCSPEVNPDIFRLTVGGFGLTGHITSVDIAMSALTGKCVVVERHAVDNLVEAGYLIERLSERLDYTYSWHNLNLRGDRFGSGTVYAECLSDEGKFDFRNGRNFSTMKPLPWQAYNRVTVPLLCGFYQVKERMQPRTKKSDLYSALFPFVGKEAYFRLYGRCGFREYQALFPGDCWEDACKRIAHAIQQSGALVLLASIKAFRGERAFLNFRGNGICLALDTPNNLSAAVLFAHLDKITVDLGGIANISKDSRLTARTVRMMYGSEYEEFRAALRNYDPKRYFQSELGRRLDV